MRSARVHVVRDKKRERERERTVKIIKSGIYCILLSHLYGKSVAILLKLDACGPKTVNVSNLGAGLCPAVDSLLADVIIIMMK